MRLEQLLDAAVNMMSFWFEARLMAFPMITYRRGKSKDAILDVDSPFIHCSLRGLRPGSIFIS